MIILLYDAQCTKVDKYLMAVCLHYYLKEMYQLWCIEHHIKMHKSLKIYQRWAKVSEHTLFVELFMQLASTKYDIICY